jgi:UDP-N-acetylglucosamine 1-carboxyvinyltransferase
MCHLPTPSVGATQLALLYGAAIPGRSIFTGIAVDPEIEELVSVLRRMGAQIEIDLAGRTVEIVGRETLDGFSHELTGDRVEAAAWACASALLDGEMRLRGGEWTQLESFSVVFERAGGRWEASGEDMIVSRSQRGLTAVSVATAPYPGFDSDYLPALAAMLLYADGTSELRDQIFERRLAFAKQLGSMGACIHECTGTGSACPTASISIRGVHQRLQSGSLEATDLRAAQALVFVALAADGLTSIRGWDFLSRGLESFGEKLDACVVTDGASA